MILDKGYQLTVLDKMLFGSAVAEELRQHPNCTMVDGDVLDISKLAKAFRDAYAVIHLAAVVGDPASSKKPGVHPPGERGMHQGG